MTTKWQNDKSNGLTYTGESYEIQFDQKTYVQTDVTNKGGGGGRLQGHQSIGL